MLEKNNEVNLDQNPTLEDDENDDSRHIERIPRRVNEWFALIDHNRERET